MDDFWNEVIEEYVAECTEMLEEMEHQLLSSEQLDKSLAADLFRPLHSFKGSSASIGLNTLAKVTHAAENLLSYFNKGEYQSSDKKYIQFFLFFSDYMKLSFDRVLVDKNDQNCSEGSDDLINLARDLVQGIQEELGGKAPPPPHPELEEVVTIELPEIEETREVSVSEERTSAEQPASTGNCAGLLDEELLASFVTESTELFTIIEQKLLHLLNAPDDIDALRECFRHIHSFKGNCGIFAFKDLETMGHLVETIFDCCIQETIPRVRSVYEAIISILDIFQETISAIQNEHNSAIPGFELYKEMLEGFLPTKQEEVIVVKKSTHAAPREAIKDSPKTEIGVPPKADVAANKRQDIRVDIRKLDMLNDLVGELVTVKTMVQENLRQQIAWEHSEKTFRLLDRIATELQDISMSVRMVPVGGLFKKMNRIVHDISSKLNKQINFSYLGEDTEIDKTISEKISDPLVHMIRNALDHGIESVDERTASGKSSVGNIVLEAKNEGGEIWIIIKDDGKGINRAAIIKKAQSQGLLDREPESYSDQEIFSMIFLPSFSTAEKVSDISGRGVGMDVVKKNIDEIKGRIEIDSKIGKGTTFTIKIPLTLAIIQGMMVRVGSNSFILPIETVSESFVVDESMLTHPMNDREMVCIRDQILPVLSLGKIYKLNSKVEKADQGVLIVAEARGKRMALLVDHLVGQKEAVVKPIPGLFKNVKGISGCSIMGDGEMSLILDIGGFAEMVDKVEG